MELEEDLGIPLPEDDPVRGFMAPPSVPGDELLGLSVDSSRHEDASRHQEFSYRVPTGNLDLISLSKVGEKRSVKLIEKPKRKKRGSKVQHTVIDF